VFKRRPQMPSGDGAVSIDDAAALSQQRWQHHHGGDSDPHRLRQGQRLQGINISYSSFISGCHLTAGRGRDDIKKRQLSGTA